MNSNKDEAARAAALEEPPPTEGICQDCGCSYGVWFAPNDVWNFVMADYEGEKKRPSVICPTCFIKRADEEGVDCTGWELRPENLRGCGREDDSSLSDRHEPSKLANAGSSPATLSNSVSAPEREPQVQQGQSQPPDNPRYFNGNGVEEKFELTDKIILPLPEREPAPRPQLCGSSFGSALCIREQEHEGSHHSEGGFKWSYSAAASSPVVRPRIEDIFHDKDCASLRRGVNLLCDCKPAARTEQPTHECKESKTCSCSIQALEPNENCPVHGGGEWPPRCGECGKFIQRAAAPVAVVEPWRTILLAELQRLSRIFEQHREPQHIYPLGQIDERIHEWLSAELTEAERKEGAGQNGKD